MIHQGKTSIGFQDPGAGILKALILSASSTPVDLEADLI